MSISSVNPYVYSPYSTYGINTATTNAGQTSASSAGIQKISSFDGDTFELSSAAMANYAALMSSTLYAPPPPPPPPAGDNSTDSELIKSFLDKVASGTATTTDLEEIQSVLSSNTQNTTDSSTAGSDPIKGFLDKVANGTATTADLEEMQSVLQDVISNSTQYAPPPPPPAGDNSTDSELIKSFLDKVANGTATITDLEEMQSVLQQM